MRMLTRTGLFIGLVVVAAVSLTGQGSRPEPVEREHFVFYFDNPRYIDRAESILNETRERVRAFHLDTLSYKPSVYLVEDTDRFRALVGGRFPDWGAAAALPYHRMIVLKSPDQFNLNKPLEQLLAHEFAHLLVAEKAGNHSVPRWFDEGMAMLVSTEWGWSDNLAMSRAAVFGEFLPLADIDKLNRFGEGKAHVAYAESYLAVHYMLDNYGKESPARFLNVIARGGSVSKALMASTGANSREFETEFRTYLTKRFNIVTLFMDTLLFWLALSVILLIAIYVCYRKRRQYFKKWEEEEKLQSTDFDYGDPDHPEQTDDEEPWRA
ncbi:MAG: hypothetical protein KAW91_04795 [candidate division Zixibacteria bacterium]|nr:hypothetical protein [candidate division Zixibacteria bacterium]